MAHKTQLEPFLSGFKSQAIEWLGSVYIWFRFSSERFRAELWQHYLSASPDCRVWEWKLGVSNSKFLLVQNKNRCAFEDHGIMKAVMMRMGVHSYNYWHILCEQSGAMLHLMHEAKHIIPHLASSTPNSVAHVLRPGPRLASGTPKSAVCFPIYASEQGNTGFENFSD